MEILQAVTLSDKTTFNIGGPARYYATVQSEEDLQEALAFATNNALPWFVLAGGSNILFSDDGFDGLVIHIAASNVTFKGTHLTADAGADLTDTIRASAVKGLSGWESMCGIPGTIGGAVRGNAGAFGTEVCDVLTSARALNAQTGEVRDFNTKACTFSYRTSFFKQHSEWIILSATFKLTQATELGSPTTKCEETVEEREKRHLQNVQCAGSFFKNPVCTDTPEVIAMFEKDRNTTSRGGKVPSGYLIEMAGCRGKCRVGDAFCSDQHADYIVNTGNATAQDVLELRDSIKKKVRDTFTIELEEEVTIVA